jgi:hypothetical protein
VVKSAVVADTQIATKPNERTHKSAYKVIVKKEGTDAVTEIQPDEMVRFEKSFVIEQYQP